jgi:hypothetical protein
MIVLEKAAKPTVTIIAKGFDRDAVASAESFGMPQLRYVVVPEVLTGLSPESIRQHVSDAFERILAVLTTEVPDGLVPSTVQPAEFLTIEGADNYDAFEVMNRQFLENEWGDGFPLIPPTPAKVDWMLTGTTRDPQDVITVLPPGMRDASVEKLAINAVMAGCEPAHLPILMAACEAVPGFGTTARAMLMSTSPQAPLMVINGPIGKEIGINSGRCALGPGAPSRHNVVIGRAFRLILMNVGGAYPGRMDMDTIGTARKFSLCFAENEGENPWEPYHVERGYGRDVSTVTLFETSDEVQVDDLTNFEPDGVLDSFAASCSYIPGYYTVRFFDVEKSTSRFVLAMCPEHARICAKAGWSKRSVREYVHSHARINARLVLNWGRMTPELLRPEWRWLLKLPSWQLEQLMLPVQENSSDYDIIVVGGPAGKSMVFSSLSGGPSTAVIKDRAVS